MPHVHLARMVVDDRQHEDELKVGAGASCVERMNAPPVA